MGLTRKFFNGIAADFRNAKPAGYVPRFMGDFDRGLESWEEMVVITANHFGTNNALFKHDKFYQACGMSQESIDRLMGNEVAERYMARSTG